MPDILKRLRDEKSAYRRRMLLVAYLTTQLKHHKAIPIVVGGHAVEIYTFQDYTTHDLDLVLAQRTLAGDILASLGFHKAQGACHWIHEELHLALEIPDHQLIGDLERLLEIEIDEFSLFVIGIEDLILDRLNAYIHWKSISDYEQALKIFLIHHDQIDHEYLVRQATTNALLEGLKRLGDDYLRFMGS